MSSPKVAIVMPCAEAVSPRSVQSLALMIAQACKESVDVKLIGITERTLIHSARNWLSKEFLATDCDWVFWMDSDMILEPRTIPVMLRWADKLKATFLTGIYYQRMGKFLPTIGVNSVTSDGKTAKLPDDYSFHRVGVSEDAKIPFKVDVCGFGCVLMHRSVFDGMKYPFFRFIFNEDSSKPDSYISEDTYFCSVARKNGTELWAVPELTCGHIGQAPVITARDFQPDKSALLKIEVKKANTEEVLLK